MNEINKKFEKHLTVKSTTENLIKVREFARTAAEECLFHEEDVEKIVLAVDEACTNIIKHAYNYSPEGIIDISIFVDNNKFVISIVDNGESFNPNIVPEPDIREFYKQKKVGGLGMYLMKKLMDEVKYSTVSDNKNQVMLIKYLYR
ncbi:MAG: ATP-binding protein [Melioribacter sp.]|nr:ATP-binding protein [Melioribacter sp.]